MRTLIARQPTEFTDVAGVCDALQKLRDISGQTVIPVEVGEMAGCQVEMLGLYEETLTDGSIAHTIVIG